MPTFGEAPLLVFSIQAVRRLLSHEKTTDLDATRLVILYALRYETHSNNDIAGLVEVLRKRGVPDKFCQAVYSALDFGGHKHRSSDLFGQGNPMAITKKFIKGLKALEK